MNGATQHDATALPPRGVREAAEEAAKKAKEAKLFAVLLEDGVLEFGSVVLNDLHVLRGVVLRNLTSHRLCINIRCKLLDQVFFQLENQNLGVQDEQSIQAVFNEINHIDKLALGPSEERQLVVSIRPRGTQDAGDGNTTEQTQAFDESAMSHMRYHSFSFKATVKLTAVVVSEGGDVVVPRGLPGSPTHSSDVVVRLKGAACRSVLQVDRFEVMFDDCIPGGVYRKDFGVRNLSEIPLTFSLYFSGGPETAQLFQFTSVEEDAEEVIKPSSTVYVEGWSHVRVGVRFSPTKTTLGERDMSIELENSNDPRNVVSLSIHTVVTTTYHDREALAVSCGDELDFGYCYTEAETEREFTLRNITDRLVFVNLTTDRKNEATFRLQESNVDGSAERRKDDPATESQTDDDSEIATAIGSDAGAYGSVVSDDEDSREAVDDEHAGNAPRLKRYLQEIHEINLNPGQTKTINVRYIPRREDELVSSSASLKRRPFKLWLRCHDEMDRAMETYTKMVLCQARVCTSFVRLLQRVVNLGDADVGAVATRVVQLRNLSELPARFDIPVKSSVLSFEPKSATIPPKQTYDIKIIFAPRFRSTNPKYNKEITITNENNEEDEQVLEVKANITDQHRATFHSLFYSVKTTGGRGIVDFGNCVVQSRSVQKVNLINQSKEFGAALSIATSSPEFRIYRANRPGAERRPSPTAMEGGSGQLTDPRAASTNEGEALTVTGSAPVTREKSRQKKKDQFLERLQKDDANVLRRKQEDSVAPRRASERSLMAAGQKGPAGTSSFPDVSGSRSRLRKFTEMDLAVPSASRPLSPAHSRGKADARAASPPNFGPGGSPPKLASISSTEQYAPLGPPVMRPSMSLRDNAGLHGLAIDGQQSPERTNTETVADDLELAGGKQVDMPAAFARAEDEIAFVSSVNEQRERVDRLLDKGALVPASKLTLAPGQSTSVYVVFEPQDSENYSAKLQNKSSKLLIQLLNFETSIAATHGVDIPKDVPVREVPIRAKVCRSSMRLQQRSINFGTMHAGDERVRMIVMSNPSEAPLLYNIVKSGSINSQNLVVDAQHGSSVMGVVRPYCSKNVSFSFKPNIHGRFHERLVVENARMAQCEASSIEVSVKAFVKNMQTFELQTDELDFGPTQPSKYSRSLRIVLTNTTQKPRMFTLEKSEELGPADASKFRSEVWFQLDKIERQQITAEESESTEEQLLALQQSFKKLTRKKKYEKAAVAKAEIARLRKVLDQGSDSESDSDGESAFDSLSDSEDEDEVEERPKRRGRDDRHDDRPHRNYVVFSMKPKATQVIFVKLVTRQSVDPADNADQRPRLVSSVVQVYESNNKDMLKDVELKSIMCPTYKLFKQSCVAAGLQSLLLQPQSRDRPPAHVTTSAHMITAKPVKQFMANSPSKKVGKATMKLSTAQLDLGSINVSSVASATFVISNTGERPLTFIVVRPLVEKGKKGRAEKKALDQTKDEVQYFPNQGVVPPSGELTVTVQITGRSAGKQEHALLVRNIKNGEDLRVNIIAKVLHPQYLECLDLNEGLTPETGKLDFGLCYINPDRRFACCVDPQTNEFVSRAVPFRLKNIHSQTVEVLPTSNTKQVKVFEDKQLELKAVNPVELGPGETHTVYIALQPTVNAENKRENGKSHSIVGGIRVEVKGSGSKVPAELTYKFEAAVAMSVVEVSDVASTVKVADEGGTPAPDVVASAVGVGQRGGKVLIDLGGCDGLGMLYEGSFELANMTASLPAEFEVQGRPRWVNLSCMNGTLEGREVDSDASRCRIQYSLKSAANGLLEEALVIVNKMRPNSFFSITFSLFVDDGALSTGLPRDNGIDLVELDPIYVTAPPMPSSVGQEDKGGFDWTKAMMESTSQSIPIVNKGNEADATLQPFSDSDVTLEWSHAPSGVEAALDDPESRKPNRELSWVATPLPNSRVGLTNQLNKSSCGQQVRLKSGQPSSMLLDVQRINFATGRALGPLKEGKMVPMTGRVVLRYQEMPRASSAAKPCKCPLPWHYDSCAVLTSRVAKTLKLKGMAGLSIGKLLPRKAELGEVGVVNSWQPVSFRFSVSNQCEIPLEFSVRDLPEEIHLSLDHGTVPGKGVLECEGTLDPEELRDLTQSSRDLSWDVAIVNSHNKHNVMKLNVSARLTSHLLAYNGIGDGDTLRLPVVQIPSTDAVDEWFSLENLSEQPLDLRVEVAMEGDLGSIVDCMIRSREANMTVSTLSLQPNEEVEVRVLMKVKPDARSLPASCASLDPVHAEDGDEDADGGDEVYDVQLGQLVFTIGAGEAREHVDVITLRGSLSKGKNFEVSKENLNLRPREGIAAGGSQMPGQTADEGLSVATDTTFFSDELVVANLSATHTLDFQIFSLTFEPEEVRVTVVPDSGSVPPGGSVSVTVHLDTRLLAEIEDFRGDDLSGKLCIQDRNVKDTEVEVDIHVNMAGWDAMKKQPLSSISSGGSSADLTLDPPKAAGGKAGAASVPQLLERALSVKDDSPGTSDSAVELGLHGCTNAAFSTRRYDVDLGQQTLSSDKLVEWELSISNPDSRVAAEYRIHHVSLDSSDPWLTLSHMHGRVSAMAPSVVKLKLRVSQMGRFSAYLLLENVANPEDLKTVRVRMEVVANYNKVKQEKMFDVVIDGRSEFEDAPAINLGTCFRGRLYRHRSFVIRNNSRQAMDFIIKSSVDERDEYDLDFSSTNTSLKKMTTVTVGPRSFTNVFIFYRLQHQATEGDKQHSVYISCRLVRDYQFTISLRAVCCKPRLAIANRKQLDFKAREVSFVTSSPPDARKQLAPEPEQQEQDAVAVQSKGLQFEPARHEITITNLADEPTEVTICNGTMFFVIRAITRTVETGEPADALSAPSEEVDTPASVGAVDGIVSGDRAGKQLHACIPKGCELVVIVEPNRPSIDKMYEQILKEKHVEEHLTIYSRANELEYRWAQLRMLFIREHSSELDEVVEFFSTAGRSQSYPFQVLEESVVQFLCDFKAKFARWAGGPAESALGRVNSGDSGRPEAREGTEKGSSGPSSGPSLAGTGSATASWDSYNLGPHGAQSGSAPSSDRESLRRRLVQELAAGTFTDLLFELHYVTDELVYFALKAPIGAGFVFQLANMLFTVCMRHPVFSMAGASDLSGGGSAGGSGDRDSGGSGNGGGGGGGPAGTLAPLRKWVSQLRYFLSFFPDKENELRPLRDLVRRSGPSSPGKPPRKAAKGGRDGGFAELRRGDLMGSEMGSAID